LLVEELTLELELETPHGVAELELELLLGELLELEL